MMIASDPIIRVSKIMSKTVLMVSLKKPRQGLPLTGNVILRGLVSSIVGVSPNIIIAQDGGERKG